MDDPVSRLLRSTTATATALIAIVLDRYDAEALYWEPEVLREELERLAGGDVPSITYDKINALTTALTSDVPYQDFYVFSHICNALGGIDEKVVFGVFEPPMPKELAWTIFELNLNDPVTDLVSRFHPDVQVFMGFVLQRAALTQPPKVLNFVEIPAEGEAPDIFADDPAMYAAHRSVQEENVRGIDTYVEARAEQLFAELTNLSLEHGNVEAVLTALKRA